MLTASHSTAIAKLDEARSAFADMQIVLAEYVEQNVTRPLQRASKHSHTTTFEIEQLADAGVQQCKIAERLHVRQQFVSNVLRRREQH